MFTYQKRLLYPINISKKDLKMASYLNAAYGGADGELGAALRYFNQSFMMPDDRGKALLLDIATEELGHIEMINVMISQLTKDATLEELIEAGFGKDYAQRGRDHFPTDNNGVPFNAGVVGAVGDCIANLYEDMAAEQKARAGYEHLLDLSKDEEVRKVLIYLREREVVHFALFKELAELYEKELKK